MAAAATTIAATMMTVRMVTPVDAELELHSERQLKLTGRPRADRLAEERRRHGADVIYEVDAVRDVERVEHDGDGWMFARRALAEHDITRHAQVEADGPGAFEAVSRDAGR